MLSDNDLETRKNNLIENWETLSENDFCTLVQEIAENIQDINEAIDDWSLLHYTLYRIQCVNGYDDNLPFFYTTGYYNLLSLVDLLLDKGITVSKEDIQLLSGSNHTDLIEKLSDNYVMRQLKTLNGKQSILKMLSEFATVRTLKYTLESTDFLRDTHFELSDNTSNSIKIFCQEQEQLKEYIQANNLVEIKKIIGKENFRLFWKYQNGKTPVEIAVELKRIEICAYFYSYRYSERHRISMWTEDEKQMLSNLIKGYIKHNLENVTDYLASKTSVRGEHNSATPTFNYKSFYIELYNTESLKPILDVLSEISDLEIYYDPYRSDVDLLNPLKSSDFRITTGTSNSVTHQILIGGKNQPGINNVLGTTIHEFTHLVCQVLWENNANPYASEGSKLKNIFNTVLETVKEKFNREEVLDAIIKDVFNGNYSASAYAAELIVRVPEIIASYPNGLEILEQQVPELLEFYNVHFLPACENYIKPQARYKKHCLNQAKIFYKFSKEKIPVENVPVSLSYILDAYLHLVPKEDFNKKQYNTPALVYKAGNTPYCFVDNLQQKKTIQKGIEEQLTQLIKQYRESGKFPISQNNAVINSLLMTSNAENQENSDFITSDSIFKIINNGARVLILGKAGMGKSTLCKNILLKFFTEDISKLGFKWVFYIPLRNLNEVRYPKKSNDYQEIDVIFKECLPDHDRTLYNLIYDEIEVEKTLWLLDGYNELQNPFPQHLHHLLNTLLDKKHVIITSRHQESVFGLKVNKKLELKGFQGKSIENYVSNFFPNEYDSKGLLNFLQKHHKENLVHTPIILELLCNIWRSDKRKITKNNTLTMTNLYRDISLYLMQVFLSNQQGENLFLNDENRVCRRLNEEVNALEKIAFHLMLDRKLILTDEEFKIIIPESASDRGFFEDIVNIGFLTRISELQNTNYEFIHQSFQEYFAARFIFKQLMLPSERAEHRKAIDFIKTQKYIAFNQLMFVFLSGLTSTETKANEIFWNNIHAEPLDIVGFKHILLLLNCLQEVECETFISKYSAIFRYISERLSKTLKFSKKIHSYPLGDNLLTLLEINEKLTTHNDLIKEIVNSLSLIEDLYKPTLAATLVKNGNMVMHDFLKHVISEHVEDVDQLFKYAAISIKKFSESWLEQLAGTDIADSETYIKKFNAFKAIGIQKLNKKDVIDYLCGIASSGLEVKSKSYSKYPDEISQKFKCLAIETLGEIGDYSNDLPKFLENLKLSNQGQGHEQGQGQEQNIREIIDNALYKLAFSEEQDNDVHDDNDDDYYYDGDEYHGFTDAEVWLIEQSRRYSYVREFTLSIKGETVKVSRDNYNLYLLRKLNEESLNLIQIGLIDKDSFNILIKENIHLRATPLFELLKTYASFSSSTENELLGQLICKRLFLYNNLVTLTSNALVVHENDEITILKASDQQHTCWLEFLKKFSTLLNEEAIKVGLQVNQLQPVEQELTLYFSENYRHDNLFQEIEFKQIYKIKAQKLSQDEVCNLNENDLEFLVKNEIYLLKTPLGILIKSHECVNNPVKAHMLVELIAKRIFYRAYKLTDLKNRFSIDDGSEKIYIDYTASNTEFTKKLIAQLDRLFNNGIIPTIVTFESDYRQIYFSCCTANQSPPINSLSLMQITGRPIEWKMRLNALLSHGRSQTDTHQLLTNYRSGLSNQFLLSWKPQNVKESEMLDSSDSITHKLTSNSI